MDYLESGSMYGSLDSAPAQDPSSPMPTSTAIVASNPGPIIKEKIPAAPDTDTSTRQTIAKMCEYIAADATDEVCRYWASQANAQWGQLGGPCWGVWWLVKHAVKFAKDEPRLFQIGEPEALDLLIAPAVLVREPAPKEDCDGFTMLVCCLLKILGIPSVIVTVAADPSDPERWSHVFPMAQVNGGYFPMDCSHGKQPGWMVPRDHITRWQAWDLNGNPVQAFPTQTKNTLHGYLPRGAKMRKSRGVMRRRGMRGLGQDTSTTFETIDTGTPGLFYSVGNDGSIYDPLGNAITDFSTVPTSITNQINSALSDLNPVASTANSTPATPGTNWGNVISSLVSGGLKAAQLATLPPGYVMGANGQPVYTGQSLANAQLTSSFAGILPWLAIGVVAVLIFGEIGKK